MKHMIKIDDDKCKHEGHCVSVCCESHVYTQDAPGETPKVAAPENCVLCGHCIAVCPGDAISHSGMDAAGFMPVNSDTLPSPEIMENFLLSIRSVRRYKKKPVPEETIQRLLTAGSKAASDQNAQDREFVVVTDPKAIRELSGRLNAHYGKLMKLLPAPLRRAMAVPFAGMMKYIENSIPDMRRVVREYGQGIDSFFYNAPCLIAITSARGNSLGKDTCITAQETIRALAHASGLGTCISGYAISAPNVTENFFGVPKERKIQTVFMLGFPQYRFLKTVDRRPPAIRWV